jgi:NarL family two-component system sensor histidine kinase LiaS
MKRLKESLRGLQWKLTVSYTLVTVGAVLIIEMVAIGAEVTLDAPPPQLPGFLTQALLAQSAVEAASYLVPGASDVEGLDRWMRSLRPEGGLHLGTGDEVIQITQVETVLLAVVDLDGVVVAAMGGDQVARDSPLEAQLSPWQGEILRAAARGPFDPRSMWGQEYERGGMVTAAAAPIFGEDRQMLGTLFLSFTMQSRGPRYLLEMIVEVVLPSVLVFTAFAGVLGAVFGFLTARGLTRRLRELAAAADAWGQGDFSTFAQAPSADEISLLARRLNRMAEQLQNLLQTREELAALEERNRLARDLHDSVKQQVFAVTMTLGAVDALWERDSGAARRKLKEALALSRQAQQELAGLINELRPVALEGRGLASALQDLAERWSNQTGIAAQVHAGGREGLPLETERACFRVVQEALANVARHSGAGRVQITLDSTEEGLTLTIADDGRGFDPATGENRGLGLRSMRERVEAMGGELTVHSAPGRGTQVMARCGRPPEGEAPLEATPAEGGR